jgi:Holliday junction DNA helicase RuvA
VIGRLAGTIAARNPATGHVVLDVGGVGYELTVSLQSMNSVPGEGQPCALWVHTHVREDALVLFGFAEPREKLAFKLLTSVPKVGPRHAMAILGGFPLDEVVRCIAGGDVAKLTRIPGIGTKTAEQVVLSLREKIEALESAAEPPATAAAGRAELRDDAMMALVQWGWKAKEATKALERVFAEIGDDAAADLQAVLVRATRLLTER